MSADRYKLMRRIEAATDAVGLEDSTLDELCRLLPIVEGAAEREPDLVGDTNKVITFGACRRRRAQRVASRKQSGGDE